MMEIADDTVQEGDAVGPQNYDIVKATQFGVISRCLQLLNEGFDVNQRDKDNNTLLHWAAINCRKEIIELYISHGAVVDAYGGVLNSTPLHWAARHGHLSMVVLLMNYGADPSLEDGEGCAAIHLAAQFGYTPTVSYLLAKGVPPDVQDKNGMTPLMWSACRIHSADPTRLLLTLGATPLIQDRINGNTALHWAIQMKNFQAVTLLTEKDDSCLKIPNENNETPLNMIQKVVLKDNWISRSNLDKILAKKERRKCCFQGYRGKQMRDWGIAAIPFLALFALGTILSADVFFLWKGALFFYLGYIFFRVRRNLCWNLRNILLLFPTPLYFATMFWMYVVWFVYIMPVLPMKDTIIIITCSGLLWYNFFRVWKSDPGIITASNNERYKTIIDMAEGVQNSAAFKNFCTTCVIQKPLRSKHCSVCNKCIARFDHHCDILSNCIGWKNHKYFVGFLFSLAISAFLFLWGAVNFLHARWDPDGSFLQVMRSEPWVTFMSAQAAIYGIWGLTHFVDQLYQILWLGLTTNERFNFVRYKYFKRLSTGWNNATNSANPCGKQSSKPGVIKNFIDFFELECFNPHKTDWIRARAPRTQKNCHPSVDRQPLISEKHDDFQYV